MSGGDLMTSTGCTACLGLSDDLGQQDELLKDCNGEKKMLQNKPYNTIQAHHLLAIN